MPRTPVSPRTVSLHRAPADIDAAVEVFSAAQDDSYLLFVIEQRCWEDQFKLISQARAATVHNRVLVHRSKLSPLGISTLIDILMALKPQLSAAQLLGACERLEVDISPFALVKSVAKLSAANPSVWQHISSWLPSNRYVAQAGGRVVNTKKLSENTELFSRYAGWVMMAGRGAAQAGGETLQTVRELSKPSSFIEKDEESTNFWGTPVIAEWCYAPADISGLIADLQAESNTCDWCQEPFVSPQCPICSSPSFYGGSKS